MHEYKTSGDPEARDRFAAAQICWLAYLMRSVYGLTDVIFDLIQEGSLDLLKLIEKFDEANLQGASFRTYARVTLLRRANGNLETMQDGMAVKDYVRRQSRFARLTFKALLAEGKTEMEALELTTERFYCRFSKHNYAKMPPYKQEKARDRVRNLLCLGKEPISLDAPVSDDDPDGDSHIDNVADEESNPEDIVVREDLIRAIYAAIESDLLDDRERYIIEHYVGLNEAKRMSVTEIAKQVGVSRQRVSAILGEIRVKLRKALGLESD